MKQSHLLGDWGGARSKLAEKNGVSFDFHYIGDFLADPKATPGHDKRVTDWGRGRGTMDIDFGKLVGAKGLTFHITGMWQSGTFATGVIGGLADSSGIESFHGLRVDSFWLQQALFSNKVFVRVGQFAGLDSYGVQEYGGAHIVAPLDYALVNPLINAYEQFDPFSSPAVELRIEPTKNFWIKTAVMSGNTNFNGPGSSRSDDTGLHFNTRDHAVIVDEVGYKINPTGADKKSYPGVYKLGSAFNGGKSEFQLYSGAPTSNYAVYITANQAVYRQKGGSDQGLDLEFGWAHNPADVTHNELNTQITAGAVYHGPIPRRGKDSLAFGLVRTSVSSIFTSTSNNLCECSTSPSGSESIYEVSYKAAIAPWLSLQPVVQIWKNVGANNQGTAVLAGFRTFVDF